MPLPPELLIFARQLRVSQTDAENLIWMLLRSRRLGGFKFRRQHPVGQYILDFYCHEAALVIELDGGGHAEEGQAEYDRGRTSEIEGAGIRVLRFWNNDVLQNTETVLEVIWNALTDSPSSGLRPPSPTGRRDAS